MNLELFPSNINKILESNYISKYISINKVAKI